MKTLLLVTKRRAVQDMYRAELEKVFSGYLNMQPCVQTDDSVPADMLRVHNVAQCVQAAKIADAIYRCESEE